MITDSLHYLSDGQALTATAASTNSIPFGNVVNVGSGEPMAVEFIITVAADTANGDETYSFALQTDDNSSFSSATDIMNKTIARATLVEGYRFFMALPQRNEGFFRVNYTLGGTSPSVTVTAFLTPLNFIDTGSGDVYYPQGWTIV